jgi:UrcA family protein
MNTTKVSKIDIALCCAFAAALLGLAGVSTATDSAPPAAHGKTIHYADLDLTKPAGAAALYSRIRVAAREVCGFSGGDWPQSVIDRACVENAIDGAVMKVNSPALSTLRFGSKTLLASN